MANLLLLDVCEKNPVDQVKLITCGDIDDYYKHLRCGCFDIARRKIGDKYYDIFCDDEGLLKDDSIVSAVSPDGKVMLVGNLIISNTDSSGNTVSLDDHDRENIMRHIWLCKCKDDARFMLVCEY